MQYDSTFYNDMVSTFELNMQKVFGSEVKELEKICKFESRGYFKLTYEYFPHNYIIEIEDEMNIFDITIFDKEKARSNLYGIIKYNGGLKKENIEGTIGLLKEVLKKNNFNFFFTKGNKLYRKNSEGIKRVRDMKEIYND